MKASSNCCISNSSHVKKNSNNPTCIDLILSNTPRRLQIICVIETRLSDIYLMVLTAIKKSCREFQPRIINYMSYKNISNEAFQGVFTRNSFKRGICKRQ